MSCKDKKCCRKSAEEIIEPHRGDKSAVIVCLQKIQDAFGYVSEEDIILMSSVLDVPRSDIYGVLTFYSQFKTTRPAKLTIDVCMGTACYVLGAESVLNEVKKILKIDVGEVTEDGVWSISASRCLGCCGLAPVVTVGKKVYGKVKPQDVEKIIKESEKTLEV